MSYDASTASVAGYVMLCDNRFDLGDVLDDSCPYLESRSQCLSAARTLFKCVFLYFINPFRRLPPCSGMPYFCACFSAAAFYIWFLVDGNLAGRGIDTGRRFVLPLRLPQPRCKFQKCPPDSISAERYEFINLALR